MISKARLRMIVTALALPQVVLMASGENSTKTLEHDIVRQVMKCWPGIDDLPQPWKLSVLVRVDIAADGQLSGPPIAEPRSDDAVADAPLHTAMSRAVNAVSSCAPYDISPNTLEWPMNVRFYFYSPLTPPGS